ncbi:hypothetical protein AB595_22925 [Massilia sp. WF1]|nr:hypothetical protein AM586_12600 [Massilia sp. WG5]KNZ68084.1 hypothetical protein AB595_22925 [Massilia sp. WF1]
MLLEHLHLHLLLLAVQALLLTSLEAGIACTYDLAEAMRHQRRPGCVEHLRCRGQQTLLLRVRAGEHIK